MPNVGPHDAHVFRYSELFFGLNPQDFPNLASLHALQWDERQTLLNRDLSQFVAKELSAIHRLCREFDCAPLLSEFALITETRAIGPKSQPYFSSFVSLFLEPARALSDAYAAALRAMAAVDLGDDTQIVPHAELYAFETAFIDIDCSKVLVGHTSDNRTDIPEYPTGIAAIRQDFHQGLEAQSALRDRVETFVQTFLSNVVKDPVLAPVLPILATSRFVLLPFVRPAFDSAALSLSSGSQRPEWRGYPGGALFLFVRPFFENFKSMPLARSLSWLLAEASVRESFAELHAEEQRRRAFVSYSITHPLKHRLGAIHADGEQLAESYLSNAPDFSARLDVHKQLVETVYGFAELCHTLHYAAVHGAADTLSAPDADGRLKFATAKSLDFTRLLTEAASTRVLGRNVSDRAQLQIPAALTVALEGFFHVQGANASVRLKNELYKEMLCELLANAVRHGSLDTANVVNVRVSVEQIEGSLALVLANPLPETRANHSLRDPEPGWKERFSESPTGLTFVADILRLTNAGRLFTRHWRNGNTSERQFAAGLALKGLKLVGESDAQP